MQTLSLPQQQLYACIDDFINQDYLHTLVGSMERLQVNYVVHHHEESGVEDDERAQFLDIIRDANRITTFLVELSEKFAKVNQVES